MPYTSYIFYVALITTHGEGLLSDPIVRTTLEGRTCYIFNLLN